MPKRTQIRHLADRFLVAEEGGDPRRPNLTIFAHARNVTLQAEDGVPRFETEGQDRWAPVAEVVEGVLVPRAPSAEQQVEFLRQLLQRYLWERAEERARVEHPWWYVVVNGRPLHLVDRAQPAGLLLPLYSEQRDAAQALATSGAEGEVCSTGAHREFLRFRAEEGFAGAVVDGREYVYWCLDEDSEVQFLKLRPDDEGSDVQGHLLDERGQWVRWDGERELEFFENQVDWDRLMAEVLGVIPFLSYADDMEHFALYRRGEVAMVEDDEEQRVAAVFSDPDHAREYARSHELDHVEVQTVADLRELVGQAAEAGAVTRIEPEEHRARGGLVWLRDGRLVLDSFSGFWDSEDGSRFRPIVT